MVFLAELPDKSLLVSLVLGTRYPGRWVWAGVSAAFLVHVVIACAAGRLLTLAPRRLVEVVVAVLFAVAAYLLLRPAPATPEGEVPLPPEPRLWPVLATSFGFVFVGEWGDITQIATANLVARYDDVLSVGAGAALGLLTAAALAVTAGQWLLRHVRLQLVRRGAGLLMAAFAVTALGAVLR